MGAFVKTHAQASRRLSAKAELLVVLYELTIYTPRVFFVDDVVDDVEARVADVIEKNINKIMKCLKYVSM